MKHIWVLLCLLSPTASRAPAVTPRPSSPALAASGAFLALSVADLAASTRWYAEKLGLQVVMQVPRQEKTVVTVLEGGGLIVELIQHAEAQPATADRVLTHGVFKVGLMLDNYEQALGLLRARQVAIAYGPFPAQGRQRANVIIRDNAGNLIQLFAK